MDKWNRKGHFDFFMSYDNPFFNICSNLDVSVLYRVVKEHKLSFFIASLFLSLKAANKIEQFRFRIRNENVIVHDVVHAGSTVLNVDNETFSFCYFDYSSEFELFDVHVSQKLKNNQKSGGKLNPKDFRDDMIHYSIIPWISFTSISHPRKFSQPDSIPKIVFGKFQEVEKKMNMPISVEAHHSLMDGIHVARFLNLFQNYMNDSENILTTQ